MVWSVCKGAKVRSLHSLVTWLFLRALTHPQVQEKFKLDLSDEEAIRAFDDMLNETSYITLMLDRLHDAAQFFRS